MPTSTRTTAAIRFRIAGPVRFLSHAQTLRVWQRVCVRAAFPVRYTQGYNPHPRLSLPLPRPVGVEADDELLVARLRESEVVEEQSEREIGIQRALAAELPEGMEVLAVALRESNASFHPRSAAYVLPVRGADDPERARELEDRIRSVMDSECCMVERVSPGRKAPRRIDVRPFLVAIHRENRDLIVQHLTGAAGSVRVEEILQLLGRSPQDLAGPVRRTNVTWEITPSKETNQQNCFDTRAEDIQDGT